MKLYTIGPITRTDKVVWIDIFNKRKKNTFQVERLGRKHWCHGVEALPTEVAKLLDTLIGEFGDVFWIRIRIEEPKIYSFGYVLSLKNHDKEQ